MSPKMRHFYVIGITGMCLFGWMTVLEFTFKEWQTASSLIRMFMVALVFSYPLPWLRFAKDKFASLQIALLSYVALGNALWMILVFRHACR